MIGAEQLAAATREVVARALAEDLGEEGDVTTEALVPPEARGAGTFVARAPGVLAGTAAATEVFAQLDREVRVSWARRDGDAVEAGDEVGQAEGVLRSLLAGERTALNLLGHLSGVATLTRRFVEAAGPAVRVLDTRKTLPGLRLLEKAAVSAGGGANHRMGLYDAVLIKDNHLAVVGVSEAVRRAKECQPGLAIEVECETLAQVIEARDAGADRVLLDNMTPEEVREAVSLLAQVGRRVEAEVSGGVTLDNVAAYAATGVDCVSVGALTHSAPALDLSFELEAR